MQTTTKDFSYEYRQKNPGSQEAFMANRLYTSMTRQTSLVEDCLKNEMFQYDDIFNLEEGTEVFQWAWSEYFQCEWARDKFDAAGIPYLFNGYGTWVGLTSFGTAWDVYVVTELCEALYN